MTSATEETSNTIKPDYVTALERFYGAPSQDGFGSAVFYERLPADADLEQTALAQYRYFVGDLWERYGEDAWMGPWRQVYTRPADGNANIVAELRSLEDRAARQSAALIVDEIDNAEDARAALAAAFDSAAVTELSVYKLGDGAAMSGILVAAHRAATGEMLFLIFLLD